MSITYDIYRNMISEATRRNTDHELTRIDREAASIQNLLSRDDQASVSLAKRRISRLRKRLKQVSQRQRIETDKRLYQRDHALRVMANRLKAAEQINVRRAINDLA